MAGLALAFYWVQRPLTAPLPDTVQIADMTWVEVRSALARGYTTVIVPSGGIEQNGPHMVLGKHDYIVGWSAVAIAKELGRTLVAPVIPYVPEGDYDPPTGHLRFPGTIGIPEEAYAGMLEGIARSLKAGGFKTICFIADHAGSLRPQTEVAERLSREWGKQGVRVIDVSDYYADAAETDYLKSQGETPGAIGQHAGISDTSELMAVHPEERRYPALRRYHLRTGGERSFRRSGSSRTAEQAAGPAQHQDIRRDQADQSAGGWATDAPRHAGLDRGRETDGRSGRGRSLREPRIVDAVTVRKRVRRHVERAGTARPTRENSEPKLELPPWSRAV